MKISISVKNVNGYPLKNVSMRISPEPLMTLQTEAGEPPAFIFKEEKEYMITFEARKNGYTKEEVRFKYSNLPKPSFVWDHPCCKMRISTQTLEMVLSRIAEPRGIPVNSVSNTNVLNNQILVRDGSNHRSYLDLEGDLTNFVAANSCPKKFYFLNQLDVGNQLDGKEWERFNHGTKEVIVKGGGTFRWVRYRYKKNKTYLIALWIPKGHKLKKGAMDAFVFFTPTTANLKLYKEINGEPPFGLSKLFKRPTQPFVRLGQGYLGDQHHIIPQMVASTQKDNSKIIVLPINNSGNLDCFKTGKAATRTLKEIAHYLHKMAVLKRGDNISNRFRLKGNVEPIPPIGNLYIGAFSSGYARIATLMRNLRGAKEFRRKWKELWDIDGEGSSTEKLFRWQKQERGRVLRMIHGDATNGDKLFAFANSKLKSRNDLIRRIHPQIKELVGENISVIYCAEKFLRKDPESHMVCISHTPVLENDASLSTPLDHVPIPNFGTTFRGMVDNGHHFIMKIGVGYCNFNSK